MFYSIYKLGIYLFGYVLVNCTGKSPFYASLSFMSLTLQCYWWRRSWKVREKTDRDVIRAETDEDCLRGKWQSWAFPLNGLQRGRKRENNVIFTPGNQLTKISSKLKST